MSCQDDYKGKTFCPIPFVGIYYRGDDNYIQSCCWQSNVNHSIKDYDNNIQKYWTSDDMRKMRKQFAENQWPESCDACRLPEQQGKKSPRTEWRWSWQLLNRIKNTVEPGKPYLDLDKGTTLGTPVYFDYRPDNICNLGCAMCSPAASSILEKMVNENPQLNKDDVLLNTINYNDDFETDDKVIMTSLGKYTRRIKLNGGEPTISSRIKSIYDLCIKNDWAKNIELQFTTNFTNLNSTWTDYLPHFKCIYIAASLDGAGDTYNYTRKPANWNAVTANILKVINDSHLKEYNFSVNLVWSVTTCFTIADWLPQLANLYNKIIEKKYSGPGNLKGIGFTLNQCYSPRWVSLHVLPPEYKDYIKEQIQIAFKDPEVVKLTEYCKKYRLGIVDTFSKFETGLDIFKYEKKYLHLWQDHIIIYDKARGSDITSLHPKYKELLKHDRS